MYVGEPNFSSQVSSFSSKVLTDDASRVNDSVEKEGFDGDIRLF